jgi:hypothetical protein
MFDVFYFDKPTGLFPHEQQISSIEQAYVLSRTRFFWIVNYLVDYSSWDFLWEPVPWEANQRHAWPSQWQKDCGTYLVPKHGYVDTNYHSNITLTRLPDRSCWKIPSYIDTSSFDFSWHPDYSDPSYEYHFPTQWQPAGGPIYLGSAGIKICADQRATSKINYANWHCPDSVDFDQFDFTWHPNPLNPPCIYQFGTQHQGTGGPKYIVAGGSEIEYVSIPRAYKNKIDSNWKLPEHLNKDSFDLTWHPDHRDPPYCYQFPTQWNRAGGPEYITAGATEIKFVSTQVAKMMPTDKNWAIPDNIEQCSFDFSWTPDPTEPPYIYQFGTQWQKTGGPSYVMPGATEVKYITAPRATKSSQDSCWETTDSVGVDGFDWTWHPDSTETPYIYQFGTQHQRTGGPRYVMPGATEVKYINAPRATKSSQDSCWEIPEGADVESFDWSWHPDSTEPPYIYQFGTQHQRTGGPRYVMPGATEIKYTNQIVIRTQRIATKIYVIDHMDGAVDVIKNKLIDENITVVRYFDNYLDTLKRIASNADNERHEFIWIVSSICDYSNFDFSWHPEQWQATMLHVFPSNAEQFGDTFFMHVPSFKYRIDKCQLLEWYDVNYVKISSVPRRPVPVIRHEFDTHVAAIQTTAWPGPLAVFAVDGVEIGTIPTVPLWREKTKTIVPLSRGGSAVIIPKSSIPYIKEQVYDYPYIDKTNRTIIDEAPMDIVFVSNGEPNAEQNFNQLTKLTQNLPNQLHRIDGINGRVASQHAAAQAATTKFYFLVPAKLEVSVDFDWSWQPDRLQRPKHYIFNAKNPVNGLIYGHMATVVYNKELVLATQGLGLDFTMEQPHEVIPILSGTAYYNVGNLQTYRTAFREAVKLRASLPNIENEHRLTAWTKDSDEQYSKWGALDGIEYYEQVNGDPQELKKTYEWDWLASYALMRRGISSDQ